MRPLSERWPKPVLPIDGRPVIASLLRELVAGGFSEVTVVTDPHYNTLLSHEIVGHPVELDRGLKMETAYAGRSWLLRGLIKDTEGFMSRHVERRISLALTRYLARTSVTPNSVTLVCVAIGLAAAPFFLSSAPALQLTGALLFLLHSILDGCDGEIARLKFLESPGGAALDFWGDNTVHVAVFGCMAVGWSLSAHSAWPLVLGAVAIASTLFAASVVAPHVISRAAPPPRSAGARMADALANRDFIYLIVVLSVFGKAAWFIVFVAIGTPIFVLVRLWADRPWRKG